MTYPNSPYGQGFPGQPGYQPSYTQQPFPPILSHPQQPGGQQSGAGPAGEPSSVTGIIEVLFNSAFGLMCAVGAAKLYERQMRGRWLVVGACALAISSTLLIYGVTAADAPSYGHARGAFALVGLVFPIVTLVLALLPSTAAWIRAKQNPVAPQPYPQHPGWS